MNGQGEDIPQDNRKYKKRRRSYFPSKQDVQHTEEVSELQTNTREEQSDSLEICIEEDDNRNLRSPLLELSPTPSFIPIKSPDDEVYLSSAINLDSCMMTDMTDTSPNDDREIIPLATIVIRPIPIRTVTPNKKSTVSASSIGSSSNSHLIGSHQMERNSSFVVDLFSSLHSKLISRLNINSSSRNSGLPTVCGCEAVIAAFVEGCQQIGLSSIHMLDLDDAVEWLFPICKALVDWSLVTVTSAKASEVSATTTEYQRRKVVRFNNICGASVSPPDDRRPYLAQLVDDSARHITVLLAVVDQATGSTKTFSLGDIRRKYSAVLARGLIQLNDKMLSSSYIGRVCLATNQEFGRHVSEFVFLAELLAQEFETVLPCSDDRDDDVRLPLEFELECEEESGIERNANGHVRSRTALREHASWLLGSAIRCRLRWLLDEEPPTITTEVMSSRTAVALAHLNLLPPLDAEVKHVSMDRVSEPTLPLRSGVVHVLSPRWVSGWTGARASETKEGKALREQHERLITSSVSWLFAQAAKQLQEILWTALRWRGGAGEGGLLSGASFVPLWVAAGLESPCAEARLQVALAAVAGEAAREFLYGLVSSEVLISEGETGGVWATLREFGALIDRFGFEEISHFGLFQNLQAISHCLGDSGSWLAPDLASACWETIQSVLSTQGRKRALTKGGCSCSCGQCSGSLTITALREVVLRSGFILCFPEVVVEPLT